MNQKGKIKHNDAGQLLFSLKRDQNLAQRIINIKEKKVFFVSTLYLEKANRTDINCFYIA